MDPVACGSCGARFPVNGLAEKDQCALHDQSYYHALAEELRMLRKVQGFYRRNPEARKGVHARYALEDLCAGSALDPKDLPSERPLEAAADVEEELEMEEFLWQNNLALGPRMRSVAEQVERLKDSVGTVPCPSCKAGRLQVASEDWDQFVAQGAITWYLPELHSVASDGTLHVKASGLAGGSHWTGEKAISPQTPEYEFWCWFIAQKEHHRLVEESELPAIREKWGSSGDPG
jgi:hypothetical protein